MSQVHVGDITEIRYSHPVVGSGSFAVKSDSDFTFDPGGYRNDDDKNMIDGKGRRIYKKNRVAWGAAGPIVWDMVDQNELEKLQLLAEQTQEADWTVTSINGTVWGAKGLPVGDIEGNTNQGTIDINISGSGKMKKIA